MSLEAFKKTVVSRAAARADPEEAAAALTDFDTAVRAAKALRGHLGAAAKAGGQWATSVADTASTNDAVTSSLVAIMESLSGGGASGSRSKGAAKDTTMLGEGWARAARSCCPCPW